MMKTDTDGAACIEMPEEIGKLERYVHRNAPLRNAAIVLAFIFLIEIAHMVFLHESFSSRGIMVALFDATLLSMVFIPLLYWGFVSPLRAQIRLLQAREQLYESRLQHQRTGLEQAIISLADGIEQRDFFKVGHSQRVADLVMELGIDLDVRGDALANLYIAARIHDIGIVIVPGELLNRADVLTQSEMDLIHSHAQVGHDLLGNTGLSEAVADILLQHHERMDGSGYPAGLKGEAILFAARILAVADVVEAMSHDRAQREAHGLDAALAEIKANRGKLYDAEVVDACLQLFRREKTMSLYW